MTTAIRHPLTIYYDSRCPICATEMTTLTRLDVDRRLALFDCAGGRVDDACRQAGLSSEDLLAVIHARDADGRWLSGVDVFVAAYDAAGLAMLAALFGHRRLRPVWDRLYPWIARNRYRLSRLGLAHLFRLVPHRVQRVVAARSDVGTAPCSDNRCGIRIASSPDPTQ